MFGLSSEMLECRVSEIEVGGVHHKWPWIGIHYDPRGARWESQHDKGLG